MDTNGEMAMPAMHGLVELWDVLSESDKQAVSDFFEQWAEMWNKWRDFMAPTQRTHFFAYMNTELLDQVAAFRRFYAKQLVARAGIADQHRYRGSAYR